MTVKYPENVIKIARILSDAGYRAYAVGGCIRDSIMGRAPSDWDMTTDASPDKMLEIFENAGIRTIPTGLQHGTVTVLVDGKPYECTTFRIDGSYTDARHPDKVTFTRNIDDDLCRRDFTVNAMAGDPLKNGDESQIIDLFGGLDDIRMGVIQCVGEPEKRFGEDALRILRAARFATVLGFRIDEKTASAAKKMGGGLAGVSAERKKVELEKILLSDNADEGAELLFSLDIAKYIHPDLKRPRVKLCTLPRSFSCRAAALFDGEKIPDLSCMKLSGLESSQIRRLCEPSLFTDDENGANARRLLSVYGSLAPCAALLHGKNELVQIILSEQENCPAVTVSALKINGQDLKNLGIEPRKMGKIMTALLDAVIENPELNEFSTLCTLAVEVYDGICNCN